MGKASKLKKIWFFLPKQQADEDLEALKKKLKDLESEGGGGGGGGTHRKSEIEAEKELEQLLGMAQSKGNKVMVLRHISGNPVKYGNVMCVRFFLGWRRRGQAGEGGQGDELGNQEGDGKMRRKKNKLQQTFSYAL